MTIPPAHTYPNHPITGVMDNENDNNGNDNQINDAAEDINENNGNDNQGNDTNEANIDIESKPDYEYNDEHDDEENTTP